MKMRRSRVLEKLRRGNVVSCVKLNLFDPKVVEIAAMAGADCIWLDMEHVPTDWATIENAVRAGKIYDADVMVRVAKGSYSDYLRPLEADAAGIMVPHLMSVEEARQVVQTTRFHPLGRRPVDGGNTDGAYCTIDLPEYARQANESRFICIQIEDPEPLDQIDSIAQVEGIDMILFGPGDFSHGIGCLGQWNHPKIVEARKRIADVCQKHGKVAATVGSPDNLGELIAMGYRFISVGADVIALGEYFQKIVKSFQT
jgi:4-hydroxy-2-oxoheptanedioate aldolase